MGYMGENGIDLSHSILLCSNLQSLSFKFNRRLAALSKIG